MHHQAPFLPIYGFGKHCTAFCSHALCDRSPASQLVLNRRFSALKLDALETLKGGSAPEKYSVAQVRCAEQVNEQLRWMRFLRRQNLLTTESQTLDEHNHYRFFRILIHSLLMTIDFTTMTSPAISFHIANYHDGVIQLLLAS